MSRIRSIKRAFWSSEQVMACSRSSRLLFIGLWNFCDDAGRHVDSAKTIKAQIFPGDVDADSSTIRGMIDELSSNGLLKKYEVDGRAYLQVTGWYHQKIDKPQPSKLPAPEFDDHSSNHSSNVRRPFAPDGEERKGRERSKSNNIDSLSTAARATGVDNLAKQNNPADGPATALPTGAPSRPPGTENGEAKRPPSKKENEAGLKPGDMVGPEVLMRTVGKL